MSATYGFYMIPNRYPNGADDTLRSVIIEGQLIPAETDVQKVTAPTQFAISSNVITFTITQDLYTHGGGDLIVVYAINPAIGTPYILGTYTTTSATSSTVVAALTHADVSATALTGVYIALAAPYATGGLSLAGFVNPATLAPIPVGNIGPLASLLPKNLQVFTLKGSTQNYKVDLTGTTAAKVLAFTGITQATNSTLVPTDIIGFRGEWAKGAF